MRIAVIDKDQFATLLRFGKLLIPEFCSTELSENGKEEESLRTIIISGNPIEYPEQYIIVKYEPKENNTIDISDVSDLIATTDEGLHSFTNQFRRDLIIQEASFSSVFEKYKHKEWKELEIRNGIIAFRTLCELNIGDDYEQIIQLIIKGLSNREKFHHHYIFSEEEKENPYSLMIRYDRHSAYPKGKKGYYFDIIETFCYISKPEMGHKEEIAHKTDIGKKINSLDSEKAESASTIYNAIKDEPFSKKCQEMFSLSGGLLVPYLFFYLRDRIRNTESFSELKKDIEVIKKEADFKEALDTASIFIGGFFGYSKFYEDYYSSLHLQIIKEEENKSGNENLPMDILSIGCDQYKYLIIIIDNLDEETKKVHNYKNFIKGLNKHMDDSTIIEELISLIKEEKNKIDMKRIQEILDLKEFPRKVIKRIQTKIREIETKS